MSGMEHEKRGSLVRCIRVYNLLRIEPRGWTTSELADRLEVTVRSVQRYIDALRQAGVLVDAEVSPDEVRAGGGRCIRYRMVPR